MARMTPSQDREQLQEQLERLGIYYGPGELDFVVKMCLVKPDYVHPYTINPGTGVIHCKVHFSREEKTRVAGYAWTQYRAPVYQGRPPGDLSIADLEARLKACSWRLQQQTFKALPEIFGDLLQLSGRGTEGERIADALKLKYLLGTPAEQYINLSAAKQKYGHHFFCRIEGNTTDLRVGEIALMVGGHCVFKPENPDAPDLLRGQWIGLASASTAEGQFYVKKTYPAFDLRSQCAQLPLAGDSGLDRLVSSLCHGIRWPATLRIKGRLKDYMVSVDASRQSVLLEDEQNITLPYQALIAGTPGSKKQDIPARQKTGTKRKKGKGL